MSRGLLSISFVVSAIVLSGCLIDRQSRPNQPFANEVTAGTVTAGVQTDTAAKPIQTYQLNEAAAAGSIVHTVTFAEILDTIPASATIATYDLLAQDAPAADGFHWVHVKGTVVNNSKQSQVVNSLSFTVVDSNHNMYEPLTADTILYVPENKAPVSLSVQPTQTVEWETYFLVPVEAENVQLQATDLSYVPKDTVLIDLAIGI